MPTPDIASVPSFADYETFKRTFNQAVQKMNNLLVQLDTLNIAELNARVIIAGTVTADKMNVNELSAISANLGHITAGLIEAITMVSSQIYGSYIATGQGVYPRAEMSSNDDAFAVYRDLLNNIKIIADFIGSPQLQFNSGTLRGSLFTALATGGGSFVVNASGGNLQLSGNNVRLLPNGGNATVPTWGRFSNDATGQTLQQALDSKGSQSTQDYLVNMVTSLNARETALENA